jgi:hypothetical protein
MIYENTYRDDMYTKTDYTRTKYGQYKDDNSKILTMPTYYITIVSS